MKHAMRSSIWLILLATCLPTCSPAPTWFHVPYDHVRAYLYNLDGEDPARWSWPGAILRHGELNPTVVDREGVTLTAAQVDELRDAATHGKSETTYFCFNPRHAFVFYDADDQPVAWFEVCFECHNSAASPMLEDLPDFDRIRDLCVQLGLPVFDDPDDYVMWQLEHVGAPDLQRIKAARAEEQRRMEAAEAEAQRQVEEANARWVAAMPPSLIPLWDDESHPGELDLDKCRAVLETHIEDRNQRVLALLTWYGSGEGSWTDFPGYESVPKELLLDYPTAVLNAIGTSLELSPAQLEGLARLFAGETFERRRPDELQYLSATLKGRLLEHVRESEDAGKRATAERVFG